MQTPVPKPSPQDARSDRLIITGALIAVCALFGLLIEVVDLGNEVDAEAHDLAAQEYQLQQHLIARQASERLGALLTTIEQHIETLDPPDDPLSGDGRWLAAPTLSTGDTATVFLHDEAGRVLSVSPGTPAPMAKALMSHAHTPNSHHDWRGGHDDFCGACLHKGHMHTLSRPLPGHPGLFVAGGLNQDALYESLFASLAGPHGAYVWVISDSETVVSAPSSALIGTQPFKDLDGEPAATLGPVLKSMKAGTEGRSRYWWPDANGALTKRLVAWSPVAGAPELSVAYSADAALVTGMTHNLQTKTRSAQSTLFMLIMLVLAVLLISAIYGVIRERRARRLAELAEARYRATLDFAADMLLEVDPATGQIVGGNRVAMRNIGRCMGQPLASIHSGGCGPKIQDLLDDIARHPSEPTRLILNTLDGQRLPVTVRAVLIESPEGAFIQWALRDISQMESAHRQAIRMEKLSQIGLMTSSIAHEIKNPLTFVMVNVATAIDMMDEAEIDRVEIIEMLSDARVGAERIQDIAAALGTVGRRGGKSRKMDLRQSIRTALMLGGPQIERHCCVVQDMPDPLYVEGRGGELAQVLLNITVNAAQACQDHSTDGRISIVGRCHGDKIVLMIEDNGPGIPDEVLNQVFEPFFTTKDEGEGTGLGLSISSEIIARHNGDLQVSSTPGRTIFTITLPAARDFSSMTAVPARA